MHIPTRDIASLLAKTRKRLEREVTAISKGGPGAEAARDRAHAAIAIVEAAVADAPQRQQAEVRAFVAHWRRRLGMGLHPSQLMPAELEARVIRSLEEQPMWATPPRSANELAMIASVVNGEIAILEDLAPYCADRELVDRALARWRVLQATLHLPTLH